MISINKTKDGQFFVRITAKNNQILFNGEPLKEKKNAKKQILAAYEVLTGKKPWEIIEVRDNTLKNPKKIYV